MHRTGFFAAKKTDGRWWLVDPEGCLFISVGRCSVNHSGVDGQTLLEKFSDQKTWAIRTAEMLKQYGFNTLG